MKKNLIGTWAKKQHFACDEWSLLMLFCVAFFNAALPLEMGLFNNVPIQCVQLRFSQGFYTICHWIVCSSTGVFTDNTDWIPQHWILNTMALQLPFSNALQFFNQHGSLLQGRVSTVTPFVQLLPGKRNPGGKCLFLFRFCKQLMCYLGPVN